MSELSMIGKIIKALETAKQAGVGVEFAKFDAIELLGHIKSLEEACGLAEEETARLENAWFVDETIQADGSLRPSLLDTVKRAEKAEREASEWHKMADELLGYISHKNGCSVIKNYNKICDCGMNDLAYTKFSILSQRYNHAYPSNKISTEGTEV